MPTLHLTGPLGTSISVEVPEERELLGVLRRYGRQGWTSGEIPAGGLSLPLAMADNFDWALIGARAYTSPDGEQAVIYKGQSYKRRELDEVDTKKIKLPRIVKYSRGARPTDPLHLKEGEEGGVQYITLISFRGAGRVIEAYLDASAMAGK
jgi:DdrB-like protein